MKVTILTPVEHDGKALQEGDTADLAPPAAKALIAAGAAVAQPVKGEPAGGKKD